MNNINNELFDFLIEFGLSEREITLYLTLLKTGPNTIMNLARETGIKRSTTHNNVEELIKKGLVSQTNYGERRMVIAEDPEKLKFLMDQKKWRIKKMEETLPDVIQNITKMVPESVEKNDVEVKYYEGKDGVRYVYELVMKSDGYYSFADLEKYYKLFPESEGEWNDIFAKNKKREVWDILVDSEVARNIYRNKHERYHVKFLPNKVDTKEFDFADYIFFDNKVAIVQLDIENPLATVIQSNQMSLSLKALHEVMWSLLPDPEK